MITIRQKSPTLTKEERERLAAIDLRAANSKGALPNYPMCAKCVMPVRAYGVEHFKNYIEVWAECCHCGIARAHECRRVREKKKILIKKPRADIKHMPGDWLKAQIRMLVFFG